MVQEVNPQAEARPALSWPGRAYRYRAGSGVSAGRHHDRPTLARH